MLLGAKIKPDTDKRYKVGDISNALRTRYGGKNRLAPEIVCNEATDGVKQLWEIRFCYKRNKKQQPTTLLQCQNLFSNKCSGKDDEVRFPPVATNVVHSEL